MTKEDQRYGAYVQILKEELIPAMGCTEPIALAYGAAVARDILGTVPERVTIGASGSIIKNVKSVIVPNTGHLKGIPAAAAARDRGRGCFQGIGSDRQRFPGAGGKNP